MKISNAIRFISSIGFTFVSLTVLATPITYNFTVTATDGPLSGTTANGSFSYDSSVVVPSTVVIATDLLTSLNFTWDGITYNATTANTGDLIFDSAGALIGVLFGNQCTVVGCGAGVGNEQWFLSLPPDGSPFFIYSKLGVFISGHGSVTITGPVAPIAPVAATPVPAVSHPAMLALLGLGLFGLAVARRRSH